MKTTESEQTASRDDTRKSVPFISALAHRITVMHMSKMTVEDTTETGQIQSDNVGALHGDVKN